MTTFYKMRDTYYESGTTCTDNNCVISVINDSVVTNTALSLEKK